MFYNFWIISTIICWIVVILYTLIMTHKASKMYTSNIKFTLSEKIYILLGVLLLYSIPFLNVIFLSILLYQDMDKLILETAEKNNWELKNQDNNDDKTNLN